ncbi:cell wall metabolism sensor histidine kinase WalK [Shewanella sp. NIFS-20-20]|uniref:sensor histidine kinase n=1 Tax=Shewanella sp. NIFS-20-20 TaxID=2853806 RepID=UPI001C4424C5|nr:HAMP domain-containing sensor histidine kinase [Shewanella sp. NIFS-20-20]MBV7314390.1 HAMP domain-containing histidine kinase [Shewanella sp. NIFS-20-20]
MTHSQLWPWLTRHVRRHIPLWLRSSAIQQGLIFVGVFIASMLLMTVLTYHFVEHKLDRMEDDITEQSLHSQAIGHQGYIDGDDIIDSDQMLAILASGFAIIGFMITLAMVAIIIYISRRSQRRIAAIEAVLLTAADGDLSARTGISYHSDDLAKISATVDVMLSRLQATVDAMTDISANIAHELKTPISRLQYQLLNLEQLMSHHEAGHKAQEALEKAIDESQRISATFDALLRISQIESGARRSRFSPVSMTDVVTTLTDIYQDVADDAGIHFGFTQAEQPCYVLGDKELLLQLLANLVENAIRYCPAGSHIQVSCEAINSAAVPQVLIVVADTGPGIPIAERQRVFERLYRLDKSRTDSGLGLGLSLVKAIAHLHSGHIQLDDNAPGLKASLSLPLLLPPHSLSMLSGSQK